MKISLSRIMFLMCVSFTATHGQQWKVGEPTSLPVKRAESGMATANGKLYLVGGRGIKPADEFDPKTNSWTSLNPSPIEMNHFQAVSFKDEIYVMGAFTGPYPHEIPIPNIYKFLPTKNEWIRGAEIPEDRRRGAAGSVVYKDKIYLVCGETDGHWDGHVAWFDEYNPKNDTWKKLPDAPHVRDHVSVAIVDDKLYIAGGRLSTARTNQVLNTCVKEVDVYDFKTGKWSTLDASNNIPTLRAGNTAVVYDNKVLIIGGESDAHIEAHNEVEAFNPKTNKWEILPTLLRGRHGTGATLLNGKIYIAAGCGNRGGSPELDEMEILEKN
jgi:N-acetylneuraminic acid mutarotase